MYLKFICLGQSASHGDLTLTEQNNTSMLIQGTSPSQF